MSRSALGSVTDVVATRFADGLTWQPPSEVREVAKQHVLDTLAAIIRGSTMAPGRLGLHYVGSRRRRGPCTVVTSPDTTSPEMASLANGMCAHADESDDTVDSARMHPGASIVPAALAVSEGHDRRGAEFLNAVLAGYDLGVSIPLALWPSKHDIMFSSTSSHGIGQAFGAGAAAGVAAGFDATRFRYLLSYLSQVASGINSVYREESHVEKAFIHGGGPASQGVLAAELVALGATGVEDVLDTAPSLFDAFGDDGSAAALLDALDAGPKVLLADLKSYPAGMPIQAPAQAVEELLAEHHLVAEDVAHIRCHLPSRKAHVVDARTMPNISVQYILAVMLLDGELTFDSAHDHDRSRDAAVRALMNRVELVADTDLDPPPDGGTTRCAIVTVETTDGRRLDKHVAAARGTSLNRMDWGGVEAKARFILDGVMPEYRITTLIERVRGIEELDSVRPLAELLARPMA